MNQFIALHLDLWGLDSIATYVKTKRVLLSFTLKICNKYSARNKVINPSSVSLVFFWIQGKICLNSMHCSYVSNLVIFMVTGISCLVEVFKSISIVVLKLIFIAFSKIRVNP